MNKLIVEYNPENGQAFTDNGAKEYVDYAIENRSITPHIIVGNELFITLFRCAIAEERIKHTEIEFLFEGKTIKISKYGRCENWPEGFGDTDMKATEILLTHQHKKAVKKTISQRICKYKGCTYYDPTAKTYCCGACSADAYDHNRLNKKSKPVIKKLKLQTKKNK